MKYAETITEEDLRDYLTILASDAMEGRETGQRGQKMAAAFIAFHFQELGLQPVVKDGNNYSYYQKFELEKSSPGEIYVLFGGEKLMNGEELVYWGRANMKAEMSTEVVFLGKGDENIIQKTDVKGKAAVIMAKGAGFQQWRSLSESMNKAEAAITFLVVAETTEDYSNSLSQYKRYFMGSSLGFKKKENTSGGIFLISQETAASFFGIDAIGLKTATADHPFVIAAKAATQSYHGFSWIPALRFAAAGMTK